ncbi:MAG: hypothetical protein A2583_12710 [Bdellovibrionales bacterium RIFOXYD1_FULL_53_11]|nr:MAG: hypothetical protein A2583_12710 [Bdellovibrionales bacterium RIFOXYD1_FULL_53_11]
MRREYWLQVSINGRIFRRVIIDDHYEQRHRSSITDGIIINPDKDYIGVINAYRRRYGKKEIND